MELDVDVRNEIELIAYQLEENALSARAPELRCMMEAADKLRALLAKQTP